MNEHPAIPRLTPDECAMTVQASTAEHVSSAFVLAYLHWSRARGDMLPATPHQVALPVVSAGQAWLNALPLDYDYEEEEGERT